MPNRNREDRRLRNADPTLMGLTHEGAQRVAERRVVFEARQIGHHFAGQHHLLFVQSEMAA